MIRCGITGHTGLIGKEIIKYKKKIQFIKFNGDVRSKSDIKKWLLNQKVSSIIHLAAVVSTKLVNNNFKKIKKINYIGTKNLIDVIVEEKIKLDWFFFASSSHVYKFPNKRILLNEKSSTKPFSKYGKTKLLAENYIIKKCNSFKIPFCIGRIFSVLDIKQSKSFFFPSVLSKIKNSKGNIFFKNLHHSRDFLRVQDIADAIFHLYEKKCQGIFNIASGRELSLITIVNKLCKIFKKKANIKFESKITYALANIKKIKKTGWKPKRKINITKMLKGIPDLNK